MLRGMVISDSARLLFVHVQKTGGTTIHNRLAEVLPDVRALPEMDRHATLGTMLRAEPGLATYWTFGLVRNPFARMLSWFRMIERFRDAEAGDGSRLIDRKNAFMRGVAEKCPDFESFVMTGLDEWSRLETPQLRYLTTKGRRADLIGRQETLEADLRAVFARFELPWEPLRSSNVDHGRPDYREHYTPAMRARIETVFARDLEVFGYGF